MKKILAVIPVKLNSRRLKKKNIKFLCGKELFIWTLKSAIKSKKINQVVISTSSKKVLKIAKQYNHHQDYLRPKKLNNDNKTNTDVCLDVVQKLKNMKKLTNFKFILLLQPTSPIKNSKSIDGFISSFLISKKKFGTSLKGPIQKKYNFLGVLKNKKFDNSKYITKQINFYTPNGAMYIADINSLIAKKTFLGKNIFGYPQSKIESIDIDSIDDFKYAEYVIKTNLYNLDI